MSVQKVAGHVFISYVHEDSNQVDQLQRTLQEAGIPVWRDTADLWPGEDWRARIRGAITSNALVFLACFSNSSLARSRSYMNEELVLAIEQLRQRPPERSWLIPVRFDNCEIPDRDIGAGRTLTSIQHVDLFGDSDSAHRLVVAILRILGRDSNSERLRRVTELENPRSRAEQAAREAEARRLAAAAERALASRGASLQIPIALAVESLRIAPVLEADMAARHAIRTAARQVSRLDNDRDLWGKGVREGGGVQPGWHPGGHRRRCRRTGVRCGDRY
jgi:TIR domain